MYAKNLGTIEPTSTLITFYASLLTKSNMAAVGHFGKVFFLFLTPILLMIVVHRTLSYVIFIIGVNFHAYLRSKSNMAAVGHIELCSQAPEEIVIARGFTEELEVRSSEETSYLHCKEFPVTVLV